MSFEKTTPCSHRDGRRKFLKQGAHALSVAALATPALSLFSACAQSTSGSPAGPATPIANSSNNIYTLTFSQFSALQNAGGSVHVSVAASSSTQDLFVTRVSSASATAVSTVCTHQGCTLNAYDPGSQEYSCPCHGSVFGSGGAVVNGPAAQPLQSYSGTITNSGIQFTIP